MKRAAHVVLAASKLKKKRVDTLRILCSRHGLSSDGLKDELIERLEAHHGSSGLSPDGPNRSSTAMASPPDREVSFESPPAATSKATLSTTASSKSWRDISRVSNQVFYKPPSLSAWGKSDDEVRVWVAVSNLISIDIPKHQFTVKFSLEASWLAPEDELHFYEQSDGMGGSPLSSHVMRGHSSMDTIHGCAGRSNWESDTQFPPASKFDDGARYRWTPRLEFENCLALEDKYERYREYEFDEETSKRWIDLGKRPTIVYRLRGQGTFQERFELCKFPFDAQDLQITMMSKHNVGPNWTVPKLVKNSNSKKYRSTLPTEKFLISEEYELAKTVCAFQGVTDDRETFRRDVVYPKLTFSMKVMRRPSYYLWSAFVPMFGYVLLAFPVVILDVNALSDRLGLLLTLLLAQVQHAGMLGDMLPKVAYLTELDKHVNRCNLVLVLLTLESVLIYTYTKFVCAECLEDKNDKETPFHMVLVDRFENFASLAGALWWCGYHAVRWIKQPRTESGAAASKTDLEQENKVDFENADIEAEFEGCVPQLRSLRSWSSM